LCKCQQALLIAQTALMTLIGAIKTDSTPKINIQTFPENRKIGKIIDPQNVATLNKLINKRVIILL